MKFSNPFKKKRLKKLDDTLGKITELLFPNGEQDVARDCDRLNIITHGKIPPNTIRRYVAECKSYIYFSKSKYNNVHLFIDYFVNRSEGRIDNNEAYDIFVYFSGEANYYDTISMGFKKTEGKELPPEFIKHFQEMASVYSAGVYADNVPIGYGEFGLTKTNPIPTISVSGSEQYLHKLRFNGKAVSYERIGSTSSEVTPGAIDIYKLSIENNQVGIVYICPYHKKNSMKVPNGFTLHYIENNDFMGKETS